VTEQGDAAKPVAGTKIRRGQLCTCPSSAACKNRLSWHWDGNAAYVPNIDGEPGEVSNPVYLVKVRVNADFEMAYELIRPDGSVERFDLAMRRTIGLVRLGGDDRNDRDLRLVQGSALDRLLSDRTLRARLSAMLAARDVGEELKDNGKEKLKELDAAFAKQTLPHNLALGLTGGQGFSIAFQPKRRWARRAKRKRLEAMAGFGSSPSKVGASWLKRWSCSVWPSVKDRLLPFVNAVRSVDHLPELGDLP
jgi:hypothetical protein